MLRFDGEVLNLVKVNRKDMGIYICKAQNGVPPIRTKRVKVNVDCKSFFVTADVQTNVWVSPMLCVWQDMQAKEGSGKDAACQYEPLSELS